MKKTRPCLIISPDELNRNLHTIVIAPMTNSSKSYPTKIEFKHKITKVWIVLDQIKTINRQRIVKDFDNLTGREITLIKAIIEENCIG